MSVFGKGKNKHKDVKKDTPTTDAPTTDAPTTDAPTTDAPTTDAPTTDAPKAKKGGKVKTVPMIRTKADNGEDLGTTETADVHPDEVENMKTHRWEVA